MNQSVEQKLLEVQELDRSATRVWRTAFRLTSTCFRTIFRRYMLVAVSKQMRTLTTLAPPAMRPAALVADDSAGGTVAEGVNGGAGAVAVV